MNIIFIFPNKKIIQFNSPDKSWITRALRNPMMFKDPKKFCNRIKNEISQMQKSLVSKFSYNSVDFKNFKTQTMIDNIQVWPEFSKYGLVLVDFIDKKIISSNHYDSFTQFNLATIYLGWVKSVQEMKNLSLLVQEEYLIPVNARDKVKACCALEHMEQYISRVQHRVPNPSREFGPINLKCNSDKTKWHICETHDWQCYLLVLEHLMKYRLLFPLPPAKALESGQQNYPLLVEKITDLYNSIKQKLRLEQNVSILSKRAKKDSKIIKI